jgi:hypothetical protein
MACVCGAPEKQCGGTFRAVGPKYYAQNAQCNKCGDKEPFHPLAHDGKNCKKCKTGTYKVNYYENRSYGVRCDKCGNFYYGDDKLGKKCTLGVCSRTGQRTWVGCRVYEEQLRKKR